MRGYGCVSRKQYGNTKNSRAGRFFKNLIAFLKKSRPEHNPLVRRKNTSDITVKRALLHRVTKNSREFCQEIL